MRQFGWREKLISQYTASRRWRRTPFGARVHSRFCTPDRGRDSPPTIKGVVADSKLHQDFRSRLEASRA